MSAVDLGGIDLLRQFSQSLVKKKVGIIEFCESDAFCNKPLYPRQRVLLKLMFLEELDGYEEDVLTEWIHSIEDGGEVEIAPKIRERTAMLKERGYDHFTMVQLILGRRSGKGYVTGAAMAKKMYDLIQIESPTEYFGIAKGEHIYFSIVADSQDQAKKYQFKDAKNWILDCKPLQEYIGQPLAESITVYTPADLKRMGILKDKRVSVDKSLASLRVEAFAKNARTVRGNSSIVFAFDEMAHITPGESHISDEELYKAAEPSLATYKSAAMIFANSSPFTKVGKFYKLYEQAQAIENDEILFPTMFMMKAPSWEMYRDWERDSRWRAAIMVSPDWDADIPGVLEERQKERANPDSYKVEYRSHFAEVIDSFLDPDKVDQMFDPDHSFRVLGKFPEPKDSGTIEYAYKAHGDPSTTGANFGFAIGHVEMVNEVNPVTGQVIAAPHVIFDLIDAFYPEDFKDRTIDWLEIMPVFAHYINAFRPFEFTFDQFNSIAPIQMLVAEAQKIGAWETNIWMKPGSSPTNRKREQNFKAALNLGRVHAPNPLTRPDNRRNSLALAREELKFLQEKNGRVDKQDIGPIQTKDIADCIIEVVDVLIGESLMADTQFLGQSPQFGAQGGYPLYAEPRGHLTSRYEGASPFDHFYDSRPAGYNPAQGIRRDKTRSSRRRPW